MSKGRTLSNLKMLDGHSCLLKIVKTFFNWFTVQKKNIQQLILGPVSNWYKVIRCYTQVSLSRCHLLFKAVQACNAEDKVWPMAQYLPEIKKAQAVLNYEPCQEVKHLVVVYY